MSDRRSLKTAPAPGASTFPLPAAAPGGGGRVVIEAVAPEIDGGRAAAKRIVGELVEVSADIFTDGHDVIAAEILYRSGTEAAWRRAPMAFVDNDRWSGHFRLDANARYQFTIEAWRDPYASWVREVEKKRVAGQVVTLEAVEGIRIAEKASALATSAVAQANIDDLLARATTLAPAAQIDLLLSPEARGILGPAADRQNLSAYDRTLDVIADRRAARFSSWYELFPRSASNDPGRHGTFADVIRRLPYVRELGFDVLYFPPIHPIGRANRKGKNNSLNAGPAEVGSAYAIGGADGGHDAIHPQLGSFEEFEALVETAGAMGIEIALDFAIQCSPDHPWIKEHPEWFDWRPDGTLKYAENPPKKYEDIVNVHFYGASLPSLWFALRDIVLFWAERGVRIFRVDNPHTKPLPFWEWMIGEVNEKFPDAIFLAEAFTRPKMMKKLAKVGFQQSYTYFTWRNTKAELTTYMTELAGEMGEYYRPNFFVNTPDINPYYLQTSGRAGFVVRSTLAATLSSVWGIYSGFELCEAAPLPGKEEYLDSEKYEIRARDFEQPGNIRQHIWTLNRIRYQNPALQDFRNVTFLNAGNDQIISYFRATPDRSNALMVMVNLDPANRQECDYEIPLWEFGLPNDGVLEVEDLLGGYRFTLHGKVHRIALDPAERSAIIWRLRRPGGIA